MKKTIKLSIPEPCHEDWGKMTATEKGKHCQVCSKEVVDFTHKTDEDIVAHVMKNKNICGRFIPSQIDRELTLERKSGNNLAPIAASFLLPFTLLASGFSGSAKNSDPIGKEFTSLHIGSLHKNKVQVTVKGIVYGTDGIPLVGVSITVKETGKTTISDKEGGYSIQLLNDETLIFSHLEYESSEFTVERTSVQKDILMNKAALIKIEQPQLLGRIAPVISTSVNKLAIEKSVVAIRGTVFDTAGLPLPGITISIKGEPIRTQTDFDGNYAMIAKPGQALVFSANGFETKEITVSTISNNIDITMDNEFIHILGGIGVKGVQISESKSALSETKSVYSRFSELF